MMICCPFMLQQNVRDEALLDRTIFSCCSAATIIVDHADEGTTIFAKATETATVCEMTLRFAVEFHQ